MDRDLDKLLDKVIFTLTRGFREIPLADRDDIRQIVWLSWLEVNQDFADLDLESKLRKTFAIARNRVSLLHKTRGPCLGPTGFRRTMQMWSARLGRMLE